MAEERLRDPQEDYVPLPPVRQLSPAAPVQWLGAGWRDLRAAPGLSLAYGSLLAAVGWLILGLSWWSGHYAVLFALLGGFLLVAPVLAFALYDVSRELAAGRRPSVTHSWRTMRDNAAGVLIFAVVLTVIMLVWIRAAAMVHVFFPALSDPAPAALLRFFAVGSAVGAVFAALVFSISVFSLPLMLDRGTDSITAVLTSLKAVSANKGALLLWGGLIAALVSLGFATALLGLIVVLPWIGYASWHGYRATVAAERPQGADR